VALSDERQLAEKIWKFVGSMPPPAPDHERMASLLYRERGAGEERSFERTR